MIKKLTEEQILKRRESQKRYYHNPQNKEKKLAYCKQRYAEKSQEILAQQATYRDENRDAINARQRAKYDTNNFTIKIKKLAILQGNNL
tara:strand:- start:75 stop:341 length:267 start_codon:yes stop_codon:yes gene_type:complete